jgi:hypothetical protein
MPRHLRRARTAWRRGLSVAEMPKAPPRAWEKYPAVVRINTPADIFAVGDVHGIMIASTGPSDGRSRVQRSPWPSGCHRAL